MPAVGVTDATTTAPAPGVNTPLDWYSQPRALAAPRLMGAIGAGDAGLVGAPPGHVPDVYGSLRFTSVNPQPIEFSCGPVTHDEIGRAHV